MRLKKVLSTIRRTCAPNEQWLDPWPTRFADELRTSDNVVIYFLYRTVWLGLVSAFHNTMRIIEWLPILWRDRDWDYAHILMILSYKLSRVRKCIASSGLAVSNKRVARQIAYAEFLIERILADNYCSEDLEQHQLKWGSYCRRKKWTNGQSIGNAFHIRQNATTFQKWQQQISEERAIYQKQAQSKEKDWNRLFKHLRTYLEHWWD